jgi:hypothetical protein
MPFQMAFNKEELSGAPPVPAGWYTLQLKGFRPKKSAAGDSVSLNAELAVITPEEYKDRRVFVGMNTKMAFMWADFVHATGLVMEEVQNENAGTDKADYTLPGVFEGAETHPDDPSKWKYLGPLTNKTMEAELAEIPSTTNPVTNVTYRAKNEIRQFKCAVSGCSDKHSTNLIKNT